MRRWMTTAALTAAISVGALVVPAAPAQAFEVRPGRGFAQTDILLNSYETRQAATRPEMAWWYCQHAVGPSGGALAGAYASGACAIALNGGAAYALKRGKRAGVTIMPWGSWWNWTW